MGQCANCKGLRRTLSSRVAQDRKTADQPVSEKAISSSTSLNRCKQLAVQLTAERDKLLEQQKGSYDFRIKQAKEKYPTLTASLPFQAFGSFLDLCESGMCVCACVFAGISISQPAVAVRLPCGCAWV